MAHTWEGLTCDRDARVGHPFEVVDHRAHFADDEADLPPTARAAGLTCASQRAAGIGTVAAQRVSPGRRRQSAQGATLVAGTIMTSVLLPAVSRVPLASANRLSTFSGSTAFS